MSRIDEIKNRLERISPAEWEPCGCRFSIVTSQLSPQENMDICDTAIADMMTIEQASHHTYFIAHAPSDIRYLLDQLREREEEIRKLNNRMTEYMNCYAEYSLRNASAESVLESVRNCHNNCAACQQKALNHLKKYEGK